jgi:exopolysaccharide biosynthesis protein
MNIYRIVSSAILLLGLFVSKGSFGQAGAVTVEGTTEEVVTPGITHLHIVPPEPARPQNIHVLRIDLTDPKVRFKAGLAGDTVLTREPISRQAKRYGALAAVNADFGSLIEGDDFPQGMTVQDGELITSPKYRTGLGITADNRVYIGKWMPENPPAWAWNAKVTAADGASHPIVHWNQACHPGWISVYSHRYSDPPRSPAPRWEDAAEALINAQGYVLAVAEKPAGFVIPKGGIVLAGRGTGADWIRKHARRGDRIDISLETKPDWRKYNTIVGGGPRLLRNGEFAVDPRQAFDGVADAEDFELSYKTKYYETRHPRSMAGVSKDGKIMVLAVVDGRAEGHTGMTLREAADLLKDLGAWDAVQFDSGGSAAMVLRGEVLNHPSDGRERPVTNSLLIFYDQE